MSQIFTYSKFGNCPSTITSEASTMTSMGVEKKDVQTQTVEPTEDLKHEKEEKRIKRSRYIEMNLDESDDGLGR